MQSRDIRAHLEKKLIGQSEAIDAIMPMLTTYLSGLAPERPQSVMLLGPTGTGKTHTVEMVAEALHGSVKNVLKINCGEFQMEHEVAKLIGAPPGYLGHRETIAMLSQAKVNAVASQNCGLSIVLFDEVEKAAGSLTRMLLGLLDKGRVSMGDGTTTNFEECLIFFTSNLGTDQIQKQLAGGFGLSKHAGESYHSSLRRLDQITMEAVKRKYSPELINRIDAFVTYKPLTEDQTAAIVDLELSNLSAFFRRRLSLRSPMVYVTKSGRAWLTEKGVSREYGARELKRVIHKHITCPIAGMIESSEIYPMAYVEVSARAGELKIKVKKPRLIKDKAA